MQANRFFKKAHIQYNWLRTQFNFTSEDSRKENCVPTHKTELNVRLQHTNFFQALNVPLWLIFIAAVNSTKEIERNLFQQCVLLKSRWKEPFGVTNWHKRNREIISSKEHVCYSRLYPYLYGVTIFIVFTLLLSFILTTVFK